MLTIGQLAAHVGVSTRAIRHYHQRGLLAEPARDSSGYRRYDTHAAVDLIRIKTLADAGVPLAQVRQLLDSDPSAFAGAIAKIDQSLQGRIRNLNALRRQLAELTAGERLVLPGAVTDLLDQMRSFGVSERTVTLERDGWTLLAACSPEQVTKLAADKSSAFADPEFQRLYLAWEQAYDWEPHDPRLGELAAEAAAWLAKRAPNPPPRRSDAGIPTVDTLLSAQVAATSPAWRRLGGMAAAQLESALSPTAQLESARQPEATSPKRRQG